MKFSSTEDIDAPIDAVFGLLGQFDFIEQMLVDRGARVQRGKDTPQQGLGTTWDACFVFQDKERNFAVEVIRFDAPTDIGFDIASRSIAGRATCVLVVQPQDRTRLHIQIEVEARTLTSKLLIQSMKLTKGTLDQKFDARIAGLAKDIQIACPDQA